MVEQGRHNIDVISAKETSLKYYHNEDATPEHYVFEAHASKVPAGTTISLEFADKKLASAHPSQSAKVSSPYQVVAMEGTVPAKSSGDLIVRVDGPLPAEASIDIRLIWSLPRATRIIYRQLVYLEQPTPFKGTPVRLQLGNFILIGK